MRDLSNHWMMKCLHEIMQQRNIPIITVEESVLQGGFGSAVLEFATMKMTYNATIKRMGIPDQFIEHGDVDQLLKKLV